MPYKFSKNCLRFISVCRIYCQMKLIFKKKKNWRKKPLNITVSKKSIIVIKKKICLCSTNFIINCMHILCEALNSIHVYIYIWCTMYLLIIFFFLLFSSSIVSWMPVILSNQWLDLTCTYKLYILTYTYMHLHES